MSHTGGTPLTHIEKTLFNKIDANPHMWNYRNCDKKKWMLEGLQELRQELRRQPPPFDPTTAFECEYFEQFGSQFNYHMQMMLGGLQNSGQVNEVSPTPTTRPPFHLTTSFVGFPPMDNSVNGLNSSM